MWSQLALQVRGPLPPVQRATVPVAAWELSSLMGPSSSRPGDAQLKVGGVVVDVTVPVGVVTGVTVDVPVGVAVAG